VSVINNMLKDLNKRQAPERSPDYINASKNDAQQSMIEPQRANNLGLISLVLTLVLLVIGIVWYLFFFDQKGQIQVDAQRGNLEGSLDQPVEVSAKQSITNTKEPIEKTNIQSNVLVKSIPALPDKAKTEPVAIDNPPIVAKKIVSPPKISSPQVTIESMLEKQPKPKTAKKVVDPVKPIAKAKTVKVKTALTQLEQDAKMAKQAVSLFNKGDVSLAYRHLFDFIYSHEVDQKSRIILASHLLQDKRVAEAGDVILGASVTGDPQYRQIKARWHEARGEVDLAMQMLSSDLPEIQKHPSYYVLLASYYQRFGQPEKAVKIYTYLLEHDDHIADWWAGLAIASDRTQQWQQAKFAYQQALRLPNLNTQIIPYAQKRLSELNLIQNKAAKNKAD